MTYRVNGATNAAHSAVERAKLWQDYDKLWGSTEASASETPRPESPPSLVKDAITRAANAARAIHGRAMTMLLWKRMFGDSPFFK